MAQIVFKRHEKKYLLTGEQYQRLMLVLNGVMDMDVYGRHTIRNIYLDTPDYELIRTSIEKPVYKGRRKGTACSLIPCGNSTQR